MVINFIYGMIQSLWFWIFTIICVITWVTIAFITYNRNSNFGINPIVRVIGILSVIGMIFSFSVFCIWFDTDLKVGTADKVIENTVNMIDKR